MVLRDLLLASLIILPQEEGPIIDLVIIRNQDSALTACQIFLGLQAKHGRVPESPDLLAPEGSSECMGSILKEEEIVALGDFCDFIHFTGIAPHVGHNNRLC